MSASNSCLTVRVYVCDHFSSSSTKFVRKVLCSSYSGAKVEVLQKDKNLGLPCVLLHSLLDDCCFQGKSYSECNTQIKYLKIMMQL